jgi:hypothetical protein
MRMPPAIDQKLLREFAHLNRRRREEGITPLELLRWMDLTGRLEKAFPGRPAPTGGRTRVVVAFESRRELRQAIMVNLRPIGLFVPTPFAAEPGTRFELCVSLADVGESADGPVVVVSNNVGPEFSTRSLGMGVRFEADDCPLRRLLERVYG